MKEKSLKTGIMAADLCIQVFLAWSRLASQAAQNLVNAILM